MLPILQHAGGRDRCVWWFRYKRDDGIDMTATLYLPPGYNKEKEGPLPCLIWAYPREFKSKDAAGKSPCQLPGSSATLSALACPLADPGSQPNVQLPWASKLQCSSLNGSLTAAHVPSITSQPELCDAFMQHLTILP